MFDATLVYEAEGVEGLLEFMLAREFDAVVVDGEVVWVGDLLSAEGNE